MVDRHGAAVIARGFTVIADGSTWRIEIDSSETARAGLLELRLVLEYRRDGWPLCPQCGEDELASAVLLDPVLLKKAGGASRGAMVTDQMLCYGCRWSGCVPRRDEALRWGLLA